MLVKKYFIKIGWLVGIKIGKFCFYIPQIVSNQTHSVAYKKHSGEVVIPISQRYSPYYTFILLLLPNKHFVWYG